MSALTWFKGLVGITDQTPKRGHVEAMAAADRAIEESQRVTQELRQPLPSLRPQYDSIVEWLDELEHRT